MEQTYGDHGVWGETRNPPKPIPNSLSFEQARINRFALPISENGSRTFYGISHHAVVFYRFVDSTDGRGRVRYLCWMWSAGQLLKELHDNIGPFERPAALGLIGAELDFTNPETELVEYTPNQTLRATTTEKTVRIVAPTRPNWAVRLPLEQGSIQPRRPGDPDVRYRTRQGKAGKFVVTWTGNKQGIQSVNGVCEFWHPKNTPVNPEWEVEFDIGARNFRIDL